MHLQKQHRQRSIDHTLFDSLQYSCAPVVCKLCSHQQVQVYIMADIKMGKVKGKLQGLKDKIESAEEREHTAKAKHREMEEDCDKNENEADSFRRRITLVRDELAKCQEHVKEKEEKLAETLALSQEHECACKQLEGNDRESDERLVQLELEVSEATQTAKESDERLQETKQKLKVTLAEVEKARERVEKLESRATELEETISANSTKLREMETEDAQYAENETEKNEMLEFLQEQLKEAVARLEEAARKVQPQEGVIDDLTQEHDMIKEKIANIRQEMKDMEDMVDQSIDDDVDVQEPKKVTDRYQAAQEEPDPEPADPEPEPEPEDRSDSDRDED